MLGLSNDAWVALGAIGGTIGTIVPAGLGWLYKTESRSLRIECKAKVDASKSEVELLIKDMARDVAVAKSSVDASEKGLKAAWLIIDDLRFNSVRKQDQDKLRDEFRADIDKLGTRLEAAIKALSDDLHRNKGGI